VHRSTSTGSFSSFLEMGSISIGCRLDFRVARGVIFLLLLTLEGGMLESNCLSEFTAFLRSLLTIKATVMAIDVAIIPMKIAL